MYSTHQIQDTVNGSFRNRFANKPYLPSAGNRKFTSDTKLKYNKYEADGKAIFAVTLSTFVSNEKFAKSDRMRKFWVRDFLYRVSEQLPHALREKVDYNYVIERSPHGHYHYHGLLATPREAGDKIWRNGMLNKELDRDLQALRKKGEYRDFAVNSFLIEPVRAGLVDQWVGYMTKTHDYIMSSAW